MRFLKYLLFFFISFPVLAEELKPLPEIKGMELATYASYSNEIEQRFDTDQALDFKVTLPDNFQEKTKEQLKFIDTGQTLVGEIFHAYGSAYEGKRSYFVVSTFDMPREISAKSWLIDRVLKNGYTLRGLEVAGNNEDELEAFYVRLNKVAETEVVRVRGFKNNGRMVLVEFIIPSMLWERDRDKQVYAIKSFEFLNEYEAGTAEELVKYQYLDAIDMVLPKSLQLKSRNTDTVNAHYAEFLSADEDGYELAKVNVALLSRYALNEINGEREYSIPLTDTIKLQKNRLDIEGYITDDLLENRTYNIQLTHEFQVTEVYPLRKKQPKIFVNEGKSSIVAEFWLTIIKGADGGNKNFVVSMIAPSRTENFYNWALAERAYKMMIESMK